METSIRAVYMRGGTSKGLFFLRDSLPLDPLSRDPLLLRIIGSPDPYGKQMDGMGGGTSSTSKVVLVGPSSRTDCDVDYLFGQVPISKPMIDWSGNCGNLTSAVGPFAIRQGLVSAPRDGAATVRIWQVNTGARIHARIPMAKGEVVEEGDCSLDGIAFPGAEIRLDFFPPEEIEATKDCGLFPTGSVRSNLLVPDLGEFDTTMIFAGHPTVFVHASALGLRGNELQEEVNNDLGLLERCEAIRAHAAVVMGLAESPAVATDLQPHTPKLAFASRAIAYLASNGRSISERDVDLNTRIFSMGKLHHAITGTGAIAIAVAAAVPGTVLHDIVQESRRDPQANATNSDIRFGHPSGVTSVHAEVEEQDGIWRMKKTSLSRTARRLMEGFVFVPEASTRESDSRS